MKKMQLIGNIGKDAILREVNKSYSINFSVACNEKFKNKENVEVEKTTWVNCTLWRQQGQSTEIAKYLKSGTKVYVEGIPDVSIYENSNGDAVAELKLKITNIELLSKKEENNNSKTKVDNLVNDENFDNKIASETDDDLPF